MNSLWTQLKEYRSKTIFEVINNFSWLSIDKIIRLAAGVIIFGWMARYLGPDNFGLYNYSIAFIALFSAFTTLGLSGIIVRDLVRNPNQKNEILGTVFGMKLIGAFLGFILVVMTALVVHQGDSETPRYVTIIAIGIFFQPFTTIDLWFQSQIKSKYVVIPSSISFIFTSLAYILSIITEQSLQMFLWITVGGSFLNAVGLLVAYVITHTKRSVWRFRISKAGELLGQSWLLILSGFGAMINLKIDQVMIGRMIDSNEVGVYSAAVRLSEVWYFVPTFIVISVFPILIKSREKNKIEYQNRVQRLYDLMVFLALLVAIIVTLFAKPVINLIYGQEYQEAAPILSIHIWAGIFIFMGEALSKWIINEDLLFISPIRHGIGGIVNIVLNIFLIPLMGGLGAAISTVVSYATSSYLICFIHPKTRNAGKMMTRSLFFPFRLILAGVRQIYLG